MSELRDRILERNTGGTKKVLLIEGKDDEIACKHLMDKPALLRFLRYSGQLVH